MDKDIKNKYLQLMQQNAVDKALELLQAYVSDNATDDEGWYLIGNAYRKKDQWQQALNAYQQAIECNPASPAKQAYAMIVEILNFYDQQRYNA